MRTDFLGRTTALKKLWNFTCGMDWKVKGGRFWPEWLAIDQELGCQAGEKGGLGGKFHGGAAEGWCREQAFLHQKTCVKL